MDDRGQAPPAIIAAAHVLALEASAGTVVDAWNDAGIESIVLKGPTLASWLYPEALRRYGDIDLLPEPDRVLDAAAILGRLGFEPGREALAVHSHPWLRRADGAVIDLHVNLWGVQRLAQESWLELRQTTERQPLGGVSALSLDLPGRALSVVLHAAQHPDQERPREDLRRALGAVPKAGWDDAVALADRLWALEAMAEGLQLEPLGRQLVDRYPLLDAARMYARGGAPFAIGLARVGAARGPRAKLATLARLIDEAEHDPRRNAHLKPRRGLGRALARARWIGALIPGGLRTVRALHRARRG
jgi:hypothetical protein